MVSMETFEPSKSDVQGGEKTYKRSPSRDVDVSAVGPVIPLQVFSEESRAIVDSCEPAVLLGVAVEHDPVGPSSLDADSVVRVALSCVEVEHEDQSGPFKDNHLVRLILKGDICLWRVQPPVLGFALVHGAVEVVKELVPEKVILGQVELAASIPKRVLVSLAGEVEPLWVAKFVALEVEISFSAEAMSEESDHLVQSDTPVNNRSKRREHRHVGIEFGIAQMHHEGFVSHEPVMCMLAISIDVEGGISI